MKKLIIILALILMFFLAFTFTSASIISELNTHIDHYYNFTSDATDSVGSADWTNSGATHGGAIGIITGAYDFELDDSDYMSRTPHSMNTNTGTVCQWVKPETIGIIQWAWSYADNTDTDRYIGMRIANTNYVTIQYDYDIAAPAYIESRGNETINNGVWNFICIGSDGSDWYIYTDGVENTITDTVAAQSGQWFNDIPTGNLMTEGALGRTTFAGYFDGILDELMIFDKMLNTTEVQWLYNNLAPTSDQQYPFIESNAGAFSATLIYPINGSTYYDGSYNGSILFNLTNVNTSAACTINDTRWTLQNGPTFGNETVHYLNNTNITDRNISIFIQCNDSSSQVNLTLLWHTNLVPTAPTIITYNDNYNLANHLLAAANGSTDGNNDSLTYYYQFYNDDDSSLLQAWSTNDTYVLQTTDMFDYIIISAKAYDGTNYSLEYNLSAQLANVSIYAYNILTDNAITNYNITTDYKNYSTVNNGDIIHINYGIYNYTFYAFGYANQSSSKTISNISDDNNITVYMTQYYTFNIYQETTGLPFNTNETNSTIVNYYCANTTVSYNFNTTANENSAYFPVGCDWDFIKLDITYPADSYYRALMPSPAEDTVNFYVLDLNTELGVQVIFNLQDLVGDYTNGNIILIKAINGTQRTIHKQPFDAEVRVVTYLLKNGYYTLKIENAEGTSIRTIGYIISEAAAEKTIVLSRLEFVPENVIGTNITWGWVDTATTIRAYYNDTLTSTSSLIFSVYYAENLSLAYQTTQLNLGSGVFSYVAGNASFLACINTTNPTEEYEINECHIFMGTRDSPLGDWSDWGSAFTSKYLTWFCTFVIVCILLTFAPAPEWALAITGVFTWFFIKINWLTYGSDFVDGTILVILGMLAVLTAIRGAFNK